MKFTVFLSLLLLSLNLHAADLNYVCELALQEIVKESDDPNDPSVVKDVFRGLSQVASLELGKSQALAFNGTDRVAAMTAYEDQNGEVKVEAVVRIGSISALIARGKAKDTYLSATYLEQASKDESVMLSLSCKKQ